ncbi:MAG: N-acetyltransferase family protein [Polyangia bacterium]
MGVSIRRLGSDDAPILALLARDDEDFDVDDRGEARAPLPAAAARAFLDDPNVLFWIAEEAGVVAGFLSCQLIRRRADAPELLLYEIGVRAAHRRRGVGRALADTMSAWMRANAVTEVWVLADNDGAVAFYRACGFTVPAGQATYMTRLSATT